MYVQRFRRGRWRVAWVVPSAPNRARPPRPRVYTETIEEGHGRVEPRRCWVTSRVEGYARHGEWKGLGSFVPADDAARIAPVVRTHGAVKNDLHWSSDDSPAPSPEPVTTPGADFGMLPVEGDNLHGEHVTDDVQCSVEVPFRLKILHPVFSLADSIRSIPDALANLPEQGRCGGQTAQSIFRLPRADGHLSGALEQQGPGIIRKLQRLITLQYPLSQIPNAVPVDFIGHGFPP